MDLNELEANILKRCTNNPFFLPQFYRTSSSFLPSVIAVFPFSKSLRNISEFSVEFSARSFPCNQLEGACED